MKRAAVALFLVGMALFVAALGLSDYRIDASTLDRLEAAGAIKPEHREAVFREMSSLDGRYYRSTRQFLADVDRKLVEAAEHPDAGLTIGAYDRGEYLQAIARHGATGRLPGRERLFFLVSIVLAAIGGLLFALARWRLETPGIKNDGITRSRVKSRGVVGIALGAGLIGFYIALYFFPAHVMNWIRLVDPVSDALRGRPSDRWFFYGTLYTLAVAVMGARMLVQYRHNRYQLVRTGSVIFFQTGFAFLLPAILEAFNRPSIDFKNIWPLDYSFFDAYRMDGYLAGGAFGWFLLLWGLGLALLAVPLLAFFFGKRWYCSWVCGCGGLAETLGDPFRHLSNKSLRAWRIERYSVHGVLVFAVLMTAVVLVNYLSGRDGDPLLGNLTWRVQSSYGFLIGSLFAGVVGTGFYPLMGNRVWCRFGCPLAAILGIVQRFKSRFRITANGGQCISCGNCSTYCEMGIDVRSYAQRGQNVVRASCVGCGVCAAVCPRGVLRLENGPTDGRINTHSLVQIDGGPIDLG